jgi:hypothetical protein
VAGDSGRLGIVMGGSGNDEQIAANKIPGTRDQRGPGAYLGMVAVGWPAG